MTHDALQQSPEHNRRVVRGKRKAIASSDEPNNDQSPSTSTLIEFPGRTRSMPEWRKQLSQRVREVQERKAREAAEELAAVQEASTVSCEFPSGQLELVPDIEQRATNPIVEKALERLERARHSETIRAMTTGIAVAAALAPVADAEEASAEADESRELKPKLSIVPPSMPLLAELPEPCNIVTSTDSDRKRVRVISEDDVALSYLDTCLSVPALDADTRRDLPGFTRRILAATFDVLLIALMVSPVAAAINFGTANWTDPRALELITGVAAITLFAYFTISIALTGRTLAMRIFSLRTIDLRTGLIPTGGQSIKRAIAYVFSLAFFGSGLLYAFIDPDRRTIPDRFSNTIVIRA